MHRVLVTGGAGFVGSHLVDRLLLEGHRVTVIDDLSTGSVDNLVRHRSNPRFRFLQHDVAVPYDVDVERIYNLACPASPVHYQADPIRTVETNVLGMRNALAVARRYGARLVQASTSEVYGDPLVHPQREDDRGNVSCYGPRACYDEGKRCAESLCFDFRHTHGVDARVARIFNTYGPRMAENDGRVVSNFIVQALRGEPLTVYGAGDQTRSFCYVSDLVDGLMRLMDARVVEEPVNLGNPSERTVLELAERVIRHVGGSTKIVFRPLPKDDPTRRKPDIARAREWLGFEPKVDIDEGIERTVKCFLGRVSGRRAA